ncbi:MAG: histidine kinase [Acidimicrobiales bacterium]
MPNAPRRVSRDWVIVGVSSAIALAEVIFRTDPDFEGLSIAWRAATMLVFLAVAPYSLLIRRTAPLRAVVVGFVPTMVFGVIVRVATGHVGGVVASAVILISGYALFRWGSGRDALRGGAVMAWAGVVGILTDPGTIGEAVGGTIVLLLPIEIGLMVRYRAAAQKRALSEAQSRERELLARELHDTVAHHVSAIAIQAQAGQAIAATDPERALRVLATIEGAASRTLAEMRTIVSTLRAGAEADLAPRRGAADLHLLVDIVPPSLQLDVTVADTLGVVDPAVDSAIYRIAQESITNTVRHARHPNVVHIQVDGDPGTIRVRADDDGNAVSGPVDGQGFGLLGMAERAHLLGGTFRAGPRPGAGWQVEVELPRWPAR